MTKEMASGRVRDVHFTVVTVDHVRKKSPKPSEPDDGLARIAEEVAGNLF
jgi:hypothetical protein